MSERTAAEIREAAVDLRDVLDVLAAQAHVVSAMAENLPDVVCSERNHKRIMALDDALFAAGKVLVDTEWLKEADE